MGIWIGGLCSLALAAPAHADFQVDDIADVSGAVADGTCDAPGGFNCTLREAILEANNLGDADTITFNVIAQYNVGSVITITQPVTIDGDGPNDTIIDGGDGNRLFFVNGPSATFKDVRLQNGALSNPGGDGGGAILDNSPGTLTLDNVRLFSNQLTGTGDGHGAALYASNASSTVNVTGSTVDSNSINLSGSGTGYGGGLAVAGSLSLTDSTVTNNNVFSPILPQGAGIAVDRGFSILRSTIGPDNDTGSSGQGGGLQDGGFTGTRTITNSTISGNNAGSNGGGGVSLYGGTTVTNTTFAGNSGTGGASSDIQATAAATVVTVKNTILGSTSPACATAASATIASAVPGNNIDAGTSCGFGITNGNQQNVSGGSLALDGLALNGSDTTMTHAIGPTSAALDNASGDCGGLSADQRGVLRAQGPGCDIGAFELEYRNLTVTPAGAGSGSVTATSGMNCPGDCTDSVPQGSAVTLTATPAAGSSFAGWTGCDSPSGSTCTQTLGAANEAVTATFTVIPRTLTVAKAGTGSGTVTSIPSGISCGLDCTEVVDHGTIVTLTATPSAGSDFAGWTGCDSPSGGTCTQTLGADETVTATFNLTPPPITTTPAATPVQTPAPTAKKCKKKKRKAAAAKKCKKKKK